MKNPRLRRYPLPCVIGVRTAYALFLRVVGALHPGIFAQPCLSVISNVFIPLIPVRWFLPMYIEGRVWTFDKKCSNLKLLTFTEVLYATIPQI